MFQRADMVLIYHWRAESNSADAAERHKEPFHSTMRVSTIVRMARSAMIEPTD